jgi:phospho-N-acetylmuramoyl-pentapeptide-transferase
VHYYLGWVLISFAATFGLMIPFINLLYRLKFQRGKETEEIRKDATKNFYKIREMHAVKAGVPTGGGIIVAFVVTVLFVVVAWVMISRGQLFSGHPMWWELAVLFYTLTGFGLLGLYDDLMKIFGFAKTGFFGLRMRHKLILQFILGIGTAVMLYWGLGINFINIPFVGLVRLGWWYLPMAVVLVVGFANSFDFTDGLDGLSTGLLMVCLWAFWVISFQDLDHVLSLFIAIWQGAVIAYLYFNIFPARLMLGNVGGLSFGAGLAVIGLLSGKIVALLIIGGVFIAEGMSSLLQLFSKRFMKRRIFPIAPFHHWLQLLGWEEPKIVARAWLTGAALALFGVWLAML